MTRRLRTGCVLTMLTLGALAAACGGGTVNQILADPSRYRNQEVRLSGNVTESFSIGERGAYRLSDHTGELWVVSDHGVPRDGARVTVTGTIREGFNLGTLASRITMPRGVASGIVLVESDHRVR